MAIETNFYEFIPKEDVGKKDARVITCDRLEAGKEYFIQIQRCRHPHVADAVARQLIPQRRAVILEECRESFKRVPP